VCPVLHNSAKLLHIQTKDLEISVSHPLRTSVPDAQALCAMLRWRILIFLNVNLRHFCARLRKWFGRSRCGRDNLSSTPCGVILFFLAAIGRQWRAPPFPPRRKQKTSRYRCLQLERCRGKLIHTRASAATREKRAWQEKTAQQQKRWQFRKSWTPFGSIRESAKCTPSFLLPEQIRAAQGLSNAHAPNFRIQ